MAVAQTGMDQPRFIPYRLGDAIAWFAARERDTD
jgi:hypothetical protein